MTVTVTASEEKAYINYRYCRKLNEDEHVSMSSEKDSSTSVDRTALEENRRIFRLPARQNPDQKV